MKLHCDVVFVGVKLFFVKTINGFSMYPVNHKAH